MIYLTIQIKNNFNVHEIHFKDIQYTDYVTVAPMRASTA